MTLSPIGTRRLGTPKSKLCFLFAKRFILTIMAKILGANTH